MPVRGKKNDNENKTDEIVKKECNLASFYNDPEVFLQTLRIKLYNGNEQIAAHIIINSGSHKSYITKEVASRVFTYKDS